MSRTVGSFIRCSIYMSMSTCVVVGSICPAHVLFGAIMPLTARTTLAPRVNRVSHFPTSINIRSVRSALIHIHSFIHSFTGLLKWLTSNVSKLWCLNVCSPYRMVFNRLDIDLTCAYRFRHPFVPDWPHVNVLTMKKVQEKMFNNRIVECWFGIVSGVPAANKGEREREANYPIGFGSILRMCVHRIQWTILSDTSRKT